MALEGLLIREKIALKALERGDLDKTSKREWEKELTEVRKRMVKMLGKEYKRD